MTKASAHTACSISGVAELHLERGLLLLVQRQAPDMALQLQLQWAHRLVLHRQGAWCALWNYSGHVFPQRRQVPALGQFLKLEWTLQNTL